MEEVALIPICPEHIGSMTENITQVTGITQIVKDVFLCHVPIPANTLEMDGKAKEVKTVEIVYLVL